MLEDMAVRKFGDKTRHHYIRHRDLHSLRSPDTATADDVRRYQVHLTDGGAQPPKLNSSASALRFFFGRKLPRVLSPQCTRERRWAGSGRSSVMGGCPRLEAAPRPGLKYKTALSIVHGDNELTKPAGK